MFKIALTAAALSVFALSVQAAPTALETAPLATPPAFSLTLDTPAIEEAAEYEETAYYCEWVTVYDAWGNWVTVWQCY